jgi:hypothetical protein
MQDRPPFPLSESRPPLFPPVPDAPFARGGETGSSYEPVSSDQYTDQFPRLADIDEGYTAISGIVQGREASHAPDRKSPKPMPGVVPPEGPYRQKDQTGSIATPALPRSPEPEKQETFVFCPPERARTADPFDPSGRTRLYSFGQKDDLGHAIVGISPESTLYGRDMNFVSRSSGIASQDTDYPTKMEISDRRHSERQVYAQALNHQYGAPQEVPVMDERSNIQTEYPSERHAAQRMNKEPPDEILIDSLPARQEEMADAIEGLLRGYAADMEHRLTVPDPMVDGVRWFKAEAVRDGWTPLPIGGVHFRSALVGREDVGIGRITLNDAITNVRAQQKDTDTAEVAAVRTALARLGCEITRTEIVAIDSAQIKTGIAVLFKKREGNVIEGDVR